MTETQGTTTPPPAQPAAATSRWQTPGWQKFTRYFTIACGLIIGSLGLVRMYNAFFPGLPPCASDTASATVRDIFKSKNVELTKLYDLNTVSDTSLEKTCSGRIETAAETGTIGYRIAWQGSTAQITITAVDAKPR